MLHTKRLSHRAYNAALKGWLAGQICPAREVCPNPVEKTLRNLYFSGVSRFLGCSCNCISWEMQDQDRSRASCGLTRNSFPNEFLNVFPFPSPTQASPAGRLSESGSAQRGSGSACPPQPVLSPDKISDKKEKRVSGLDSGVKKHSF